MPGCCLHAACVRLLAHENVVKFYGTCMKDGDLYAVMELATGNLTEVLASRKKERKAPTVSQAEALAWASDIARGMMYIASREMLHRDLSLNNCVVRVRDVALCPLLFCPA